MFLAIGEVIAVRSFRMAIVVIELLSSVSHLPEESIDDPPAMPALVKGTLVCSSPSRPERGLNRHVGMPSDRAYAGRMHLSLFVLKKSEFRRH
jgi:hypothetical protein